MGEGPVGLGFGFAKPLGAQLLHHRFAESLAGGMCSLALLGTIRCMTNCNKPRHFIRCFHKLLQVKSKYTLGIYSEINGLSMVSLVVMSSSWKYWVLLLMVCLGGV